jgi:isopropylmalate/homocitrate/citramalate synthase
MNNENIVEYMEHIKILSKEISEYFNEETGVKKIVPTSYLLCGIDYMELTEAELEQAQFNMAIDKKVPYKSKMVIRPKIKYEITKKEEDKNKLIDSKVKVYCVWNVSNSLKLKKSFNNKEEALELYSKINEPILQEILK